MTHMNVSQCMQARPMQIDAIQRLDRKCKKNTHMNNGNYFYGFINPNEKLMKETSLLHYNRPPDEDDDVKIVKKIVIEKVILGDRNKMFDNATMVGDDVTKYLLRVDESERISERERYKDNDGITYGKDGAGSRGQGGVGSDSLNADILDSGPVKIIGLENGGTKYGQGWSGRILTTGSVGTAGGLLCVWDKSKFHKIQVIVEFGFLGVIGSWKERKQLCVIINVYSSCLLVDKKRLWEGLLQEENAGLAEEEVLTRKNLLAE
ncbi:hypothetical protein RJT34_28902 [Clitoria ternatea]|uniref:Uncharacterized protein n=1 Tax=Clitoria ternatea TaxID=43366 RepID=A0AAN9IBT3_CLITE